MDKEEVCISRRFFIVYVLFLIWMAVFGWNIWLTDNPYDTLPMRLVGTTLVLTVCGLNLMNVTKSKQTEN